MHNHATFSIIFTIKSILTIFWTKKNDFCDLTKFFLFFSLNSCLSHVISANAITTLILLFILESHADLKAYYCS